MLKFGTIPYLKEVAEIWYNSLPEYFKERRKFLEPGNNKILKVVLDGEDWQVGNREEDRLQFLGRNYVQKTLKKNPAIRSKFAKLPGVFWFDQYRLKTSDTGNTEDGKKDDIASIESIASLRPYLLDWTEKRKTPNYNSENDYYLKLENYYKRIFKGRSFAGLEPSTNQGDEPFFVLNDENRTYDIVEMSGGEYSVFPILYEFVRQQIAYSIVLIDELDLNLHPPLAQFFVNQLPKLSPTSQFIFTTHSEAVTEIIGNDEIYRLKGGSKYGFKEKVLMSRELKPETIIVGLRDRDFDDFEQNQSLPQLIPQEWQVTDNQNSIHIGWYWERKEIENYLIDPKIVIPALGTKAPSLDNYQSILENSALKIYTYTAARISLSLSRVSLSPLPNYWGEKKWDFPFPFGQIIDEASCRLEIQRIRNYYQTTQVPEEQDTIKLHKYLKNKI